MKKSFCQTHPFLIAFLCILVSSLLIVFIMQLVELQDAWRAFLWLFTHPLGTLCSLFLIGAVQALIFSLTRRLWIGALATGAFCTTLAFVNYFKCRINAAPLILSDFTLAKDLGNIAGFAKSKYVLTFSLILAIVLTVLAAGALVFLDLRLKKHYTRRGKLGALSVSLTLALIVFLTPAFTSFSAAVSRDRVTQEERNDSFGVFYGLYCAYASVQANTVRYSAEDIASLLDTPVIQPDEPENPDPEPEPEPDRSMPETAAQPDEPEPPAEEEPVLPNVIFVMSESLFDITRLPNLEFSEDPLPTYHKLAEYCTSGSFMTPAYCGGTAYVEMEVLTGLTSYLLKENDTLTSLPTELYGTLPTIKSVFDENGYDSVFFHSHTNVLYNREPNYNAMGFGKVLFSDACGEDAEQKGGFVSDKAFAEKIISLFEERDKDKPLFMLNVSMENHQPYRADKYDEPSGIAMESPYLDEENMAIVDSYVMGARDADESLRILVDYFSAQEEPVMLIFWGDHLPNLNLTDGQSIFTKLGYNSSMMTTDWGPEELAPMLSTEYVIWTNYEKPEDVVPDHTESCTFLGLHVLQRIGLARSPYFAWLEQNVDPYMTLYRARLFVDADGVPYREVPEQYQTMLEAYRLMEYDLVYGEQRILGNVSAAESETETQ